MSQGATLLHLRGAAGMDAIYRKIIWRMLPLLMLCSVVAWLDRVNVDLVRQQLGASLGFGQHVHGWGTAAFFAGCGLFAIPCTALFEQLGARKALLRMMLGWAALSAATAFVQTPFEFYLMRFLLGVFEAGFLPGVALYLCGWFPAGRRARAFTMFAASVVAAAALAAPLGTTMQAMLPASGMLDDWQWLLLAQAAPTVLLAVAAWACLDDRPAEARWLSGFEQQMVAQDLARDEARRHGGSEKDDDEEAPATLAVLWLLLRERAMLLLALTQLLLATVVFALVHWTPALLQRWLTADLAQLAASAGAPGALGMLGIIGIIGMLTIAYDADRRRERRGHFIASAVLAAGGLALAIAADDAMAWSLAGLGFAVTGLAAATPLLLAIVTDLLRRQHAAAGIALVACAGAAGAALGPALGARMLAWGDSTALLAAMAGACVAAGLLLELALRLAPAQREQGRAPLPARSQRHD